MTLLLTNPKPKRTGSWNAGKLTFTEHYDVESTDESHDPYEVLEYVSGLVINVFHGTVLTSIDVNQITGKIWSADCTWETITASERAQGVAGTIPTDRPTIYSFATRESEAIVDVDVDGNAIINAADDPFNPAPIRKVATGVVIAKHNYNYFYPITVANYLYHTNASPIFGFDVGQVFCTNITIDEATEVIADVQIDYVQVVFEFEIASANYWQLNLLQAGFRAYYDDGDGGYDKRNIVDADGNQITDVALLDADGIILDADADPVYKAWTIYPSAEFLTLGLT